jgi:FKBP-type peptidyl-prolyl cis-trans isomerase 2
MKSYKIRLPGRKGIHHLSVILYWYALHMQQVQLNVKVTLSFTGKLENGTIFQTATESEPLIITIGNHDIPPTLEQALIGMSIGEQKLVRLEPDEGYGIRRKDLLQTLSKDTFKNRLDPQVGMVLSLRVEKDGQAHQVPATVVEANDNTIVVDYNHPLAGHNLLYDIKVLAIETAAPF